MTTVVTLHAEYLKFKVRCNVLKVRLELDSLDFVGFRQSSSMIEIWGGAGRSSVQRPVAGVRHLFPPPSPISDEQVPGAGARSVMRSPHSRGGSPLGDSETS